MTAPSPIASIPGFTIPGDLSGGPPTPIPLYTTDPNFPERIESVYFVVDFGTNDELAVVLAIQLTAQDGAPLGEWATPVATGVDMADFEAHYTWSRLGQDTANEVAVETLFSADNTRRVWFNVALPDVVLPTSSQVNLLAYTDNGNEGPDFPVTGGTITTTRNAGAVASTTDLSDILPLLVPTTG